MTDLFQFPRLGAVAILLKDAEVCLVRRRNPPDAGLWGYPGGRVEPGETALAAAARELLEETSIVAQPVRYLTCHDVIVRDEGGALLHHYLLAAVLCAYESGRPCPSDDVSEAAWVTIEDVLQHRLPMSREVDTALRLALRG